MRRGHNRLVLSSAPSSLTYTWAHSNQQSGPPTLCHMPHATCYMGNRADTVRHLSRLASSMDATSATRDGGGGTGSVSCLRCCGLAGAAAPPVGRDSRIQARAPRPDSGCPWAPWVGARVGVSSGWLAGALRVGRPIAMDGVAGRGGAVKGGGSRWQSPFSCVLDRVHCQNVEPRHAPSPCQPQCAQVRVARNVQIHLDERRPPRRAPSPFGGRHKQNPRSTQLAHRQLASRWTTASDKALALVGMLPRCSWPGAQCSWKLVASATSTLRSGT